MGHGHRRKCFSKNFKRYFPVVTISIGLGILMVVILPIWVWLLFVSLALIVFGFDKFR